MCLGDTQDLLIALCSSRFLCSLLDIQWTIFCEEHDSISLWNVVVFETVDVARTIAPRGQSRVVQAPAWSGVVCVPPMLL